MNEDFRRLNSDRFNTPSAFSSVAADIEIEFRLARIDPNGNPTTGITRTETSITGFSWTQNDVKSSNTGGRNAWNTQRYLNIWVCNINQPIPVLGYAQFPFDFAISPNTDGVVIDYKYFGKEGNTVSPFNKGKTTTHEIGHWLNLFHIWGDDDIENGICDTSECSGTDHVDDTPNQGERNYGCPSFPKVDCCTSSSSGVMFMNYMDYTDDACMNLFTNGQKERMRNLFESGGVRESIKNSGQVMFAEITGPSTICSQATYTIQNLPQGATVQWSINNNSIAQIISSSNSSVTIKSTTSTKSPITLTANISYNQTTVPVTRTVELSDGINIPILNVQPDYGGCVTSGSTRSFGAYYYNGNSYSDISSHPDMSEVEWEVLDFSSGSPVVMTNYQKFYSGNIKNAIIKITFNYNSNPYQVVIRNRAKSKCGYLGDWSAGQSYLVKYSCSNSYFLISPNPSSTFINISPNKEDIVERKAQYTADLPTFDKIVITDAMGNIQLQQNTRNTGSLRMDVSRLSNGIYYLNLYNAGKLIEKKTIQITK